jgi:hypothetical protein
MAVFLLARWLRLYLLLLIGVGTLTVDPALGAGATAAGVVVAAVVTFAYSVLIERIATGFRSLRPSSARSTNPTSGGTSATGSSRPNRRSSTAHRSRASSGACSASASANAHSTTGAASPRKPSSESATTAFSAHAASCKPPARCRMRSFRGSRFDRRRLADAASPDGPVATSLIEP